MPSTSPYAPTLPSPQLFVFTAVPKPASPKQRERRHHRPSRRPAGRPGSGGAAPAAAALVVAERAPYAHGRPGCCADVDGEQPSAPTPQSRPAGGPAAGGIRWGVTRPRRPPADDPRPHTRPKHIPPFRNIANHPWSHPTFPFHIPFAGTADVRHSPFSNSRHAGACDR